MTYWRTRITGTLTLQSPLALGDGGYTEPEKDDQGNEQGGVDTVMKTADGKHAVIPGSSLKGVLRAWMKSHGLDTDRAMGRAAKEKSGGQKTADLGSGGKFEFGFCYSSEPVHFIEEQSVAIDRVTRASAERLLFARQLVPTGTTFDVELLGFDIPADDVANLLAALEGFNHQADRVRLGSGGGNDYGRARWDLTSVKTLDDAVLRTWLDRGAVGPIWEVGAVLNVKTLPAIPVPSRQSVRFDLSLDFSGWFLVKDPAKSKAKGSSDDDAPDAYPLLTADNHVLLKARGFRGVLRSQAERIARTLCSDAGGDPNRDGPSGQTRIIEALFGDTGSKAIVECSPFVDRRPAVECNASEPLPADVAAAGQTLLLKREFVAIDRFTGGAAEHLKFDCVAAWQPSLCGSFALDVHNLAKRCDWWSEQARQQKKSFAGFSPAAAFGLLALTLRDLAEGDLVFGFGYGKGFGESQGTIQSAACPDPRDLAGLWQIDHAEFDKQVEIEKQRGGLAGGWSALAPETRALLSCCVSQTRAYFRKLQQVTK